MVLGSPGRCMPILATDVANGSTVLSVIIAAQQGCGTRRILPDISKDRRILAPGEAQIIENALRYAREAMTVAGGMPLSDAETIDAIDAALRSLLKEHGNDE